MSNNDAPDGAETPLSEMMEAALAEIRITNRSPESYEVHAKYFKTRFEGFTLADVTTRLLERWKIEHLGEGYTASTVRSRLAFLSRTFDYAIAEGLIDESPTAKVKRPPVGPGRLRWLTEAEEEQLRCYLTPRDFKIVRLYLLTGCRRAELLNVRQGDIDFEAGVLTLAKTKNGKPRYVPLESEALDHFSFFLKNTQKDPAAYVFEPGNLNNRRLVVHQWATKLKRVTKEAGLPGVSTHIFRHTFCTRLLARGVDIRTVQDLAGHSNISTTEKYCHVDDKRKMAAVRVLSVAAPHNPEPEPNPTPAPHIQTTEEPGLPNGATSALLALIANQTRALEAITSRLEALEQTPIATPPPAKVRVKRARAARPRKSEHRSPRELEALYKRVLAHLVDIEQRGETPNAKEAAEVLELGRYDVYNARAALENHGFILRMTDRFESVVVQNPELSDVDDLPRGKPAPGEPKRCSATALDGGRCGARAEPYQGGLCRSHSRMQRRQRGGGANQ